MAKINLLSEDLINKIAAGEVIERPSSVVKELIENSLDADATKITIELKNSGKDLIKITDNGNGMEKEDAKKSILRHATSKLQTADDLFAITTLGFRGEALASIAAISKLTITTKTPSQLEGFKLEIEGGQVLNETIAAANQGTTIKVENIFFNTPARKKFLKTDAVELRHIIDTVTNYSLLHNNVAFKLVHENRVLLSSPATEDSLNNIAAIYSSSTAKHLLPLKYENNNIKVEGFICKPYNCRNDKNQQVFFVNKRWIKNSQLSKAVYDGYHSMLFVNKHPVFILHLTLNPENIDVNVHPQKSEIKIEQVTEVQKALTTAVKETLKEHNLIPLLNVEFEQQTTFGLPQKKPKPEKTYTFEPSTQTVIKEPELIFSETKLHEVIEEALEEPAQQETHLDWDLPATNSLPPIKLLGQIHKTFFIAETPGGAFFIDQHATHERVLYERFMTQFHNNNIETQQLLQGGVLNLTPAESILVNDNLETLKQFGYTLEPFGDNTFILKTVPVIFNRLQGPKSFHEFLSSLQQNKNTLLEKKEEIITRMACRSAIMAGDTITLKQMQDILKELAQTAHPFTCPHGRPSIIKTTSDELEKKFRRKGC